MERKMTLKALIRKTYLTIFKQFLVCLLLFYLIPVSLSTIDNVNEKNFGSIAIFFNVTSWIYLCIVFIVILIYNIQKLLKTIKQDLYLVYHQSLYLEKSDTEQTPFIQEFLETDQHINTMQGHIREMIEHEKQQKQELMFQVSAAAHDLKTPLTVIRGNSEYLQTLDTAPQMNLCLQDIETASLQLDDYFNQFIQYSKTFYQNELALQTLPISEIADHLFKQITPLLGNKGDFELINTVPGSAKMTIDLDLLSRAILNLVSNALSYHTGDETSIRLSIAETETVILFSVWNSHSTFPEELLQLSDTLFYQEDRARNHSKHQHYGLGLAFVKRVMTLHDGSMRLENLDKGALVELRFPKRKIN